MKKKMSNRDKKILYFFGAIIAVAASYFLVFNNLKTKTDEITAQNVTLDQEVRRLENMDARRGTVEENTIKLKGEIDEKLKNFPLEVRTQNIIAELHNMYENEIEGVKIQSESYQMNQIFYQSGEAPQEGMTQIATGVSIKEDTPANVAADAASNYVGYRSDVVVAFTATYDQLQEVVNYINNSEERVVNKDVDPGNRMTITDLSATKDADNDQLVCNMTVSIYAISGTSFTYQQPKNVKEMENVSGNENGIFGK